MSEEIQNLFLNKTYLESIYLLLKGDDNELKRSAIKNYIEKIEGVKYEEVPLSIDESENINLEEFCEYFQKIFENSQNTNQIFVEGFALLDNNKKGYLDITDLKKINSVMNQHFNEDDLQGLLETAGKFDSKITFENFMEFLKDEN